MLHGPIFATLISLTGPMIIGMILLMTFGLVDTFFVSMLGTDELAAISFTFPVTFTVISLNIGLGIGTSAIIGRCLGGGNTSQAKAYGSGALILSFVMVGVLCLIGVLTIEPVFSLMGASEQEMVHIIDYMVLWYASGVLLAVPMVGNSILRAAGDTKTPSMIMAAGGLINAVLDPILIFGWGPIPAMGIQGAALATLVAWLSGTVFIIYYLAIRRQLILPRLPGLQELRETSRDILRIGLPAAGANMLTPLAGAILTAIVATYGSEAVAAWGVGSRLESLASLLVLALSMSLPPFISQNFGAANMRRVYDAYRLTIKFVLVWQLLMYGLMALSASWIASIFAKEAEVARLIGLFLLIVPIGYGVQGVIILTNSSFNAMHKPMSALILSLIRLFVFFVPLSWLGSHFYGLTGMFCAGVVANLITALLAYRWFVASVEPLISATEPSQ